MNIGLRLKLARIEKGLTQDQLAARINKTRPLISLIEKTGKVNFYTLKALCDALNLNPEEFTDMAYGESPVASEREISAAKIRIRDLENQLADYRKLVDSLTEQIDLLKNLLQESRAEHSNKKDKK
ncbi:hypothetical protein MASR2M44_23810 [Bacteroidota bacterium]